MRERVAMLVASALTVACSACTPQWRSITDRVPQAPGPPTARDEVELEQDPQTGFIVLAAREVSFVKVGTFLVVDTPDDLARALRDFEIPGALPDADFTTYRVAVLAEANVCEGGHGGDEIQGLLVRGDGRIRPRFVGWRGIACEEAWVRFVPTTVYILAIRRDRLPAGRPLRVGPAQTVFRDDSAPGGPLSTPPASAPSGGVATVGTCEAPAAPPAPRQDPDSFLTVPARGQVTLQYLTDATPVFVISHSDATIDVLAADTPSWYDAAQSTLIPLRGLRGAVRWSCSVGYFGSQTGMYDEYGIPVMAERWQSLDRYDAAPTTDGHLVVRATSRRRGHSPRRCARGTPRTERSIEAYGATPALAVADARSRPVGSRVVVDASLVVGGGLPPRLCKWRIGSDSTRVCVGAEAPAQGVTWAEPETSWSIQGPFAARVTEDGFADVTVIGNAPVPEGMLRPYAWPGTNVEGAFSTVALFGPHAAALGAEADLSFRWTRWTPWTTGSVWARLIGDDVGVGLRARGLVTSASRSSEWLVGLAPILEFSDSYRDVSYPSVPGLLVPEVGVGYRRPDAFPYLAWTVPVVFHLASPRERRHPFGLLEVLGIRIAPTAEIAFGPGSPEWQVGASAGATLW